MSAKDGSCDAFNPKFINPNPFGWVPELRPMRHKTVRMDERQALGRIARQVKDLMKTPKFVDIDFNLRGKPVNTKTQNELQLQPVNETWNALPPDQIVHKVHNSSEQIIKQHLSEEHFNRALKYCVHAYGYSSESRDAIVSMFRAAGSQTLGNRTWVSPYNRNKVYRYSDYSHCHASMCKYQLQVKNPLLPTIDWYEVGHDTDGDILVISCMERLYDRDAKKVSRVKWAIQENLVKIVDRLSRRDAHTIASSRKLAKRLFNMNMRSIKDARRSIDHMPVRLTARHLYGHRNMMRSMVELATFCDTSFRFNTRSNMVLMRRDGSLVFADILQDYSNRRDNGVSNDWRVKRQLRGGNYKNEPVNRFMMVSNPYALDASTYMYTGHSDTTPAVPEITPESIWFSRNGNKRYLPENKEKYIAMFS